MSILFLGGEVVVENSPSQERYVLQTMAEDEDGRLSATYADLKFCCQANINQDRIANLV